MNIRRILLITGPVVVGGIAMYFYLTGGRSVETENAFLKADKVMLAPEISAAVSEVLVNENQPVSKGQPLFKLDSAMFDAAMQRARANQEKVRTDLEALKESYKTRQAELAVAHTNASFAEKEYARQTDLAKQRFTSQIQLDDRKHLLDLARQQVLVLEQDIARIGASLNHDPDAALEYYPAYQVATAELAQAQINLGHAVVIAPFDGVVSNLPKPGQHLNAGSPALALLSNHNLWIDANFNEIDLTYVEPGQQASVRIDMYPDKHWPAHVASISPASGAEFSILPPQNASGNWVKVVQRIPVRIALDPVDANLQLRAGMSVTVQIDTGSNRLQRWLKR